MSSHRQVEANRLNAQNSTGPCSVEGKARSSRNALKSGIDSDSLLIFREDSSAIQILFRQYYDRHQPAIPEERTLVDTLARAEWMLRRLTRIESQVWDYQMAEMKKKSQLAEKDSYGQVYPMIEKTLARLQHRINSFDRSYRAALRDLQKLQGARFEADAEPQPGPAPSPQPRTPEPTYPQIGFVPEIPPSAAKGPVPTAPQPLPPAAASLSHTPASCPPAAPALPRNHGLSGVPAMRLRGLLPANCATLRT